MRRLVEALTGLLALTGLPYLAYLGLYWLLGPEGSPADKQEDAEPTVSIVLPTYNEEGIVEAKIDDLLDLDYPIEKLELVVADASNDETVAAIRDCLSDQGGPELIVVEVEERGVARAVNAAVQVATGDVIFRTDCDSKLAPDALRVAVANLADESVGAVTGRQSDVLGSSEVEQDYRDMLARNQILESHLDSTFICHGPCFAFERSAFPGIEPDSLADDTEIGLKIRRNGKQVVMDPSLRFTESSVSEFKGRRARKDRRAMGLVQLLLRHRDALGRYGAYGCIVLPFNWWFMLLSPWLMALSILMVTLSLSVFLGPGGLIGPVALLIGFWLGQRDRLGPVQPIYAVMDSQASLLIAQVRLVRDDVTGMWEPDRASREAFE